MRTSACALLIRWLLSMAAVGSVSAAEVPGATLTTQTVSPAGAAITDIPIPVPAGAGGLEPRLSLHYSGPSENLGFGRGWSIQGYSRITVGPKTRAVDGRVEGVTLRPDDAFYLDGERLVPARKISAPNPRTLYRKENDDAIIVTAWTNANGYPERFELQSKAGLSTTFLPGPSVANGIISVPILYLPSRTADRAGNYIEWEFLTDGLDALLSKVRYTGNESAGKPKIDPFAEIVFEYEQSPRVATTYILGKSVNRARRLVSVTSRTTGPAVAAADGATSKLVLSYQESPTSERFFLSRVRAFGYGGTELAPVAFSYSRYKEAWTNFPDLALPAEATVANRSPYAYQFGKVKNAAGAVVTALFSSYTEGGKHLSKVQTAETNGWKELSPKAPPVSFAGPEGEDYGVLLFDINGDGMSDILQGDPYSARRAAFLQTDSGWVDSPQFAPPVALSRTNGVRDEIRTADVNRDGRQDILLLSQAGELSVVLNGPAGLVVNGKYAATQLKPWATVVGDIACDGKTSILTADTAAQGVELVARDAGPDGWGAVRPIVQLPQALPDGPAVLFALAKGKGVCPVYLVGFLTAAGEAASIVRFTPEGWIATPVALPEPVFFDARKSPMMPRIADVNGDGYSDIMVAYEQADATPNVHTLLQIAPASPADPVVFERGPTTLHSPITFATKDGARATVHILDINNDTAADVVKMPSAKGGVWEAFVSNGTTWQKTGDVGLSVSFVQTRDDVGSIRFLDLNGDGLSDVVFNRGDSADEKGAYLNTGAGWKFEPAWVPPRSLQKTGQAVSPATIIDVNGDGMPDLVYAYTDSRGTQVLETYLNRHAQGSAGWGAPAAEWKLPFPFASAAKGDLGGKFADLDADGLPDLLYAFLDADSKLVTASYLNTGKGWASTNGFKSTVPFSIEAKWPQANSLTNSVLADVNGDRLPDLVASYRDPQTSLNVSVIYLNTGKDFEATSSATPPVLFDETEGAGVSVSFFDVNADGNLDILQYLPTTVVVYIGDGKGWSRAAEWDFPTEARSDLVGFAGVRISDVTGDGFADLLYHAPQRDGSYKKGAFLNTGQGWTRAGDALAPPDPIIAADGSDGGVRAIDLTGDNALDYVRIVKRESGLEKSVWLNPNPRTGLLTSVSNGRVRTSYEYGSLAEPSISAKGIYKAAPTQGYPYVSSVPSMPMVIRVGVDEGSGELRSTTYRYAGFLYDVRNAISLGFKELERTESPSGLRYDTEFSQAYGLLGLKVAERLSAPDGGGNVVTLLKTAKTWEVRKLEGLNDGDELLSFRQALLVQETVARRDLLGKLLSEDVKSFEYDEWLNVTKSVLETADGTRHALVNEFGQSDDGKRYGRLVKSSVTHSKPGMPEERRTALFGYDPATLLLASESTFPDAPAFSTQKTYQRDRRGNVIATVLSAPGLPARTESFEYDELLRTTTAQVNAENHRTIRFSDPNSIASALGLPSILRDPNGLATKVNYDAFGRISKKTGPDGVTTSFDRYPGFSIPAAWLAGQDHAHAVRPRSCNGKALEHLAWTTPVIDSAEAVRISVTGKPDRLESIKLFDPAGRMVREIVSRFDGTKARFVFKDMEYDPLGRLTNVSAPYFQGSRSVWTRRDYDAMDRKIREIRADGTCIQFLYNGNENSRVDARGNTALVKLTQAGKPAEIRHAGGGRTEFRYDAMDRVVSVTSAMGVTTSFSYDAAGNRVWTKDPDAGIVEFKYDAYGQLRGQKAASEALWTELSYDRLGRPVKAWYPDKVSIWEYDRGGVVGTLGAASSISQNTANLRSMREEFEYDQLMRIRRKTVTFAGAPGEIKHASSQSVEYDAEGRVARQVYPARIQGIQYSVSRRYHPETGQLTSVVDSRSPKPLWQLTVGDAEGRAVGTQLGNGLREISSRSAINSELQRISVLGESGAVFDQRYKYDVNGNLAGRDDKFSDVVESFGYDRDDRLTSAQRGHVQQTVSYDLMGRIVSKSGVGAYKYGCDGGPENGVCSVTAADGEVERILYNARGGVRQSGRYGVEYDSGNRVTKIVKVVNNVLAPSLYSEFEYGPSGARVYSRERGCVDDNCYAYRVKETLHLGFGDRIAVTVGTSRVTTDRYYIEANGGAFFTIDVIDRSAATGNAKDGPAIAEAYLHRDRLGSVSLLTSKTGTVLQRFRFDPWGVAGGMKSHLDFHGDSAAAWTRGFSGHDHISQFGLVHMNGRVYDPRLGVFLSVDPITSDPTHSTDLNAYAYAWNNPLTLRDLSGFGLFESIRDAFSGAGRALGDLWNGTRQFVERNWREIVTVAVVIGVTAMTAGAGSGPVLAAMAGGAAGGATSAALHGGSTIDIVGGAIVGGVFGAFGGTIGTVGQGMTYGKVAAYGALAGARAHAAGGDFGRGFAIGAITAGIDAQNLVKGESGWASAGRIAVGATASGTISELSGDKFANGALSGAFYELWRDARRYNWTKTETVARYVGLYQAREATLIGLGAGSLLWGYSQLFADGAVKFTYDRGAFALENAGLRAGEGLTLGSTVFYTPDRESDVLRHEMTHVIQWGAFGTQGFWDRYSRQVELHGYRESPFEREAYREGELVQP